MEKIYMENNNHNRKKKIDGVSILAFFVAILAVVSLVAVGFNQITFATKTVQENQLPDNFDVKTETEVANKLLSNKSFPIMMHFAEISCEGDANGCQAGKKTFPIYCLERQKDTVDTKYELNADDSSITDVGLIYLMANLYPEVEMEPIEAIEGDNADHKVEMWISQALIWVYLKETGLDPTSALSETDKQNVFQSAFIKYGQNINEMNSDKVGYTNDESKYLVDYYKIKGTNMTAHQVYDKAMELHNVPYESAYGVSVVEDGDVTISQDEKYYFSKKLSVLENTSDKSIAELKSFSITLPEGIPDDTEIVDEQFHTIEDLSNLAPGTKFYIKVPVDSIEEAVDIKLDVVGNFDTLSARRFSAVNEGDFQQLTTLKNVTNGRPAEYDFELTPAPDTASKSSMAQTMYFIGLIVLLCGVGIVYANAKNAKVKE